MAGERTLRRPKRPLAYAILVAATAVLLGLSVGATWRMAHERRDAPADLAQS